MSVSSASKQRAQLSGDGVQASRDPYAVDQERGEGWVVFAGMLLLLLGTLNFTEGLAAISNSSFFVNNTHYIFGSLNTWGWVVLCVGVVEWLVGLGVFVRNQLSRWTGVLVLGINAIAQLLMMPVSVLVTVDLHARPARNVRADRLRPPDLEPKLIGTSSGRRGSMQGTMFFDLRKQNTSAAGAAQPTDSALDEAGSGAGAAWRAWRRSAQKVTRAWKTWLAAEGRQRAEFYRLYVAALAEEERAAARIGNPSTSAPVGEDRAIASPVTDTR